MAVAERFRPLAALPSRAAASQPIAQAPRRTPVTTLEALVSSGEVNVGKFAGAVAGRTRDHGRCVIDAVGAGPCYQALKSLIIANGYILEAYPGQSLAISLEKAILRDRVAPSGRTTDTIFMRLHIRPLLALPASQDPPDILIAKDTNAGMAAGLVAKTFEGKDVVTISGMGAQAMYKALCAALIAQNYMEDSLEGRILALHVRSEAFIENAQDRTRMVLACIRADPLPDMKVVAGVFRTGRYQPEAQGGAARPQRAQGTQRSPAESPAAAAAS